MSVAMSMFLFSVVVIVLGLAIIWLSSRAGSTSNLFWWIGIVVAVLGAILLLFPVMAFIYRQLTAAFAV